MGRMATTITQPTSTAPRSGVRMPEAWLRATLAGVEAAILGWLLLVVPTIAAYIATAADPVLGEITWLDATRVATGLWLVAHGGELPVGAETSITLVPLGLSLVVMALMYGGARRARIRSFGAAGFTIGGYLFAVLGLSTLVEGPAGRGGVIGGALLIGSLGSAAALRRAGIAAPGWWRRARERLWPELLGAVRGGLIAVLLLLAAAVVATIAALVLGFQEIRAVHDVLNPGVLGAVVLIGLQLFYLPTAVAWSMAYLTGPGFSAGAGMTVTAAEVVTAPLPGIPMLGALPVDPLAGHSWLPLLPMAVGAGLGWWLHRRWQAPQWWRGVLSAVTAAAVCAATSAGLTAITRGGIGAGRMTEFGAEPLPVALAVFAFVLIGALLVVVPAHPQVRDAALRWWRAGRAEVERRVEERRSAASAADAAEAGAGTPGTPVRPRGGSSSGGQATATSPRTADSPAPAATGAAATGDAEPAASSASPVTAPSAVTPER